MGVKGLMWTFDDMTAGNTIDDKATLRMRNSRRQQSRLTTTDSYLDTTTEAGGEFWDFKDRFN